MRAMQQVDGSVESRTCPLGCALDDEIVLVGEDLLYGQPGRFQVVRCRNCGLLRTNPRPTLSAMSTFYPDEYGPYHTSRPRETPRWKRAIARALPLNLKSVPPIKPGRLLEIGCGAGAYMHHMAQQGWAVTGIEASARAGTIAQSMGYTVHITSLEAAPDPPEAFDLVVGWMVLEHLHEPIAVLQKLLRWTQPGGWLVLSTPNAATMEFRVFGPLWYALDVPRHLFHFTPETIGRVLTMGGWRVTRILHQRVLGNLAASLGLALRARGGAERIARWLIAYPENGVLQYLAFPLGFLAAAWGQTGRMTIWARKDT